MRMRATVGYDGSNYKGWQIQPGLPTIQQTIEQALAILQCHPTPIVSSGRTDAGVHARGQVFHFDATLMMPLDKWLYALNGKLPSDIVILQMEEADPSFHARFDAQWKHYDYLINMGTFDPFERNHMLQLCRRLDVEAMRQCSQLFVGVHNFAAFNKNTLEERPNQVREIYRIDLKQNGDVLTISYYGKGFLRFMVRMLTQTLIEVGKGRLSIERVQQLLAAAEKNSAPYNAVGHGLYLMEVGYRPYPER